MKWRIIQGNEGWKICAYSDTSMVLATYSSDDKPGEKLILGDWEDNDSYLDEWEITKTPFYATVANYYDKGYYVRFGETSDVSQQTINAYIDKVAARYSALFGLKIDFNSAVYYSSPIDGCKGTVTGSNIDTLCSHSGTIHTDRDNVIAAFKAQYPGNRTSTYVLWSGHKIKSVASNGDINYNRSCSSSHNVFMLGIPSLDRELASTGVLMHELNHQYGAKDHYHEIGADGKCKFANVCSDCGTNPRPSTCIINNSRIDINNSNVICSACKNDILACLVQYYQ